jgi:hypothetical protein
MEALMKKIFAFALLLIAPVAAEAGCRGGLLSRVFHPFQGVRRAAQPCGPTQAQAAPAQYPVQAQSVYQPAFRPSFAAPRASGGCAHGSCRP